MAALKDENSTVVGSAAYALGEIGDKRAINALVQACDRHNSSVQRNVMYEADETRDLLLKDAIGKIRQKNNLA